MVSSTVDSRTGEWRYEYRLDAGPGVGASGLTIGTNRPAP